MKIKMKFITSIMLSLALLPTLSFGEKAKRDELDNIAAIVNDDVITRTALKKEADDFTQKLQKENQKLPPRSLLEEKILERLVYKHLQLQIAARAKLTITNDEVDEAIKKLSDRNNMTLDQFKFALSQEGLEFNTYKEELKTQMLIHKLQNQAVQNKIKVSEEEIDELLKTENEKITASAEYHIEHYLLPISEKPTPKEWQTAKQKILNIAKDKDRKEKFEDFGWKKASELPSLFVTQLAKMENGELSVPLRAPNGFHLIKLIDSKTDQKRMTKEQATSILHNKKFEQELMDWLKKMKESSYVKVMI